MPEWMSIFYKMLRRLFRRINVRARARLELAIEYDSARDETDPSSSSDTSIDD